MRILVTNDDGINASQLIPLIRCCKKLGDVTVIVPKHEQSGKSLGIELRLPFEVKEVQLAEDICALSVDSTPADCVRFAILGLKKEFDLVISGINCGFNIGVDTQYSGTAGAALEAANLGVKAIALSTSAENYDHSTEDLDKVFDFIFDNKLLDIYGIYNVNIPPNPLGIRFTRQGGAYYSDDFEKIGEDLYIARGKNVYEEKEGLTLDTDATLKGYVSIMPLAVDKTNMEVYKELCEKFGQTD